MDDIIIFIVLAVITAVVLILVFTKNANIKSSIEESFYNKIKTLGYEITNIENKCYDQIIKNSEITFIVKIIKIPEYAEIQINNKVTWEIKYGAGNTPGKAQPYKKYLKDIENFMNYTPQDNEIKLVIATPNPKKIVKYINECEIVFVTPYTDVYGTRLIGLGNTKIFEVPYESK
ncbi:MAG: hypothetical protein E7183_03450 [Erysipelotrichaceae bacterium]|nr:hypothetical protein [Erysipelotrichaceae bacterium]